MVVVRLVTAFPPVDTAVALVPTDIGRPGAEMVEPGRTPAAEVGRAALRRVSDYNT